MKNSIYILILPLLCAGVLKAQVPELIFGYELGGPNNNYISEVQTDEDSNIYFLTSYHHSYNYNPTTAMILYLMMQLHLLLLPYKK